MSGIVCNLPAAEFSALESIYVSLGGASWEWKSPYDAFGYPWNISAPDAQRSTCSQPWQGIVCERTNATYCTVTEILLSDAGLKGRLPDDIGNLVNLVEIGVAYNEISGTIPTSLGLLTSMQFLYLSENQLSGFIPSQVGRLAKAEELYLYDNCLSGSLPLELGQLTKLRELYVDSNIFTSTIPSELGNLNLMTGFFIFENQFTGQLPTELSQLIRLQQFTADINLLSGTIPSEFGQWAPSITEFNAEINYIHGALPSEFGLLTHLVAVDLSTNFLSNSLPSALGNLTNCLEFVFQHNFLSGTVPTELGLLKSVKSLLFNSNSFTGSLPWQLSNNRLLTSFGIDLNSLSGTLPSQYSLLVELKNFYFNGNCLTGSIPSDYGSFTRLQNFDVNSNFLTGIIPAALGEDAALRTISVYTNYLTGSIPTSLRNLTNLLSLDLFDNSLEGRIEGLFSTISDAASFSNLVAFDLADNSLTGSIPSEIFQLPSLLSFSLTSNCFTGRLSCPNIALGENSATGKEKNLSAASFFRNTSKLPLEYIDMNGLSSGTSCRKYVSDVIPNVGYYPVHYMRGTLPDCIWGFENLTVLYLIGNGFTGPLAPPLTRLSNRLTNLSLSYNELTGTIPAAIQLHSAFELLDLSFNRISGTIETSFVSQWFEINSASLSNNRLSGHLSGIGVNMTNDVSATVQLVEANMLNGNLFSFDADWAGIGGVQTMASLSFNGSALLDISIYISLPVVATVMIFAVLYYFQCGVFRSSHEHVESEDSRRSSLRESSVVWYSRASALTPGSSLVPWKQYWMSKAPVVTAAALVCSIVTAFVSYLVLKLGPWKQRYSTHTFQYGWLPSAAYLHGITPPCIIFLLITMTSYLLLAYLREFEDLSGTGLHTSDVLNRYERYCDFGKVAALLVVDFSAMIVLNAAYISAVIANNPALLLIQMGVAAFKVLWNFLLFAVINATLGRRGRRRRNVALQYAILVVNFILLPCLATSIVESSCFLQLFQQQSAPILSSNSCEHGSIIANDHTLVCTDNSTTVSYQSLPLEPPFTYSFQCGSALITNYVPVVLYIYFISGFLMPVVMLLYLRYGPSDVGIFAQFLPPVLRGDVDPTSSSLCSQTNEPETHKPILPVGVQLSKVLLHLTVILTFGLAYPYLAVVALCAALTELSVWCLAVGRYASLASQRATQTPGESAASRPVAAALVSISNEIDSSLQGSYSAVVAILPGLVVVIYLFWAALSFDMIADVYGSTAGLCVMFSIMVGGPLLTFAGVCAAERWRFGSISALLTTTSMRGTEETERARVLSALHPALELTSDSFHPSVIQSVTPYQYSHE